MAFRFFGGKYMLKLVTGRIGSGKTECIYSELKKCIEFGTEVMLIVPEQYSFNTEKTILEYLGARGADKVEVVSFSFLAENLLKKYGLNSKKAIDDSTRAMLMSVALEEVGDDLKIYSRHRYSNAVVTQMLKAIKELRQCSITSDRLDEVAMTMEPSILRDKLNELAKIERTYSSLVTQNYFDDECALDLLCKVLKSHNELAHARVFVDGFRGFTAQEFAVLEEILKQADETWVTLSVDESSDEFGVFSHTQRTKRKLLRMAHSCSIEAVRQKLDIDYGERNEELAAIEKGLYSSNIEPFEGETQSVTLCSAEDFESECEYVAATVKRLIRTEGLRCRDIAIISRSESNYSRRIRSALVRNGVPAFEDKRQPIASEPLIEFVRSAVEICALGFSTDTLMRMAKTGLTGLDTQDIARLENYALMWQINGRKWLDEWTAHPNGLGEKMLERDIVELKELNELRIRLVSPLQRFRVKMKEFTSLEAARAIYDLLVDMKVAENLRQLVAGLNSVSRPELAEEQDRVWGLLMEMLDRIAQALCDVRLTPVRFRNLFELLISTYSVGSLPQGLDEITIGSADRVKLSAPKVVFAVGMNDGVFPMLPNSSGILSETEKRRLAELELKTDDSYEEKLMEERFIAYTTLCSATERLYVTYSRKDLNGIQLSPSEIVSQLNTIFPNINTVDTAQIPAEDYIESRESAFEVMARLTQEGGTLHSSLESYFENQDEYSGRLAALRRGINEEEISIKDKKTATELFGYNMYMSASRTEVYHKCPFEYFCKYGLNAQPRKKAELDPMQKGTAVHYILEKLISAYGSDGLCKMEKNERDRCVYDILEEYFKENLTSGAELGERFGYLFRQLGLTVCEVVDRLVAEFNISDFKPVAFELTIDSDAEVKTYDIALPDGGTLKLKGSIDRVDVAEQNGTTFVRVIDYKSGGKRFDLNEVFHGLNMQMLIYLFALWKNGFRDYKNLTPAGILYMPVNAPFVTTQRDEEESDISLKKLKGAKMNGMVLDDSRVIYLMENEGKGIFIPATLKSDGSNGGTLISFKQMDLLMKKCEGILAKMAVNLHNGVIPVRPAVALNGQSPYHEVCKYCDYKEVCHVNNDTPKIEIDNINHSESLNMLGGDENA